MPYKNKIDKKEYMKEYHKEYYCKNKGKVLEQNKQYRRENKEKIKDNSKEYNKEWRRNNKDKIALSAKKYKQKNKEKNKEKDALYRQEHKEEEAIRSRKSGLKRKYNITPEQYNELFEKQGGVCKICGKPETEVDARTGRVKLLSVDHNHETGEIRGLLCAKHNKALGLFDDDPKLTRSATNYLEGE